LVEDEIKVFGDWKSFEHKPTLEEITNAVKELEGDAELYAIEKGLNIKDYRFETICKEPIRGSKKYTVAYKAVKKVTT
jgi:hypothetical protein